VKVGGTTYPLDTLDCLYIGLGEKDVSFDPAPPASRSIISSARPRTRSTRPPSPAARSQTDPIGDVTKAQPPPDQQVYLPGRHQELPARARLHRIRTRLALEHDAAAHAQPPHRDLSLFDVGDNMVVHLMGEPKKTRHLVVRDREVVMSPAWSIHCGAGTGAYRFVWAMGGDNQVFADMDAAPNRRAALSDRRVR